MLFLSGALPPDLTFVVLARERNEDYVFSYLLGYQDPPAGIEVPDGQYYNVYFPGQGTSMAPPLFNDMITYEDGVCVHACVRAYMCVLCVCCVYACMCYVVTCVCMHV